ncbi:LpqB family beta-propeller domain-containing protein [Lentzea flaviverrucosa]|uniref:Sporulation and spore germination n=1 Tax=Lentzea flaviverrucosa TaxID=200379 RepID=A0A1H9U3U5_9PSEU|nr:LpqB family beta-propeller domain-containing protein [Lentzea flaviverrucosa]RDI33334.1 sporulation and spore germination protein [Lentzea flaviverrucosa]SES03743.1 Sporulation and spore germination [Lentzea flaviverrucosa]
MKRLAMLVLVLVTLAGCAAIPTNTQPKPIGSKDNKASNTPTAPEPRQNIDPFTLVRDFIEATSNPDNNYASARAFMTEDASRKWDTKNPTIIETGFSTVPTSQAPQDKTQTVLLQGKYLGRLGSDNAFVPQLGDFQKPVKVERNSENQWRISEPPAGIYMPQGIFNTTYRRITLYFYNPEFTVLVPDPRYVVIPPATSIPTRVTELLIAGPGDAVRDTLVSALGPDTDKFSDTLESDDGALEVNLTNVGKDLTPEKRKQIVAQVVKSLSGVTSSRLRVLVDGQQILPDQRDYRPSDVSATAGEALLALNANLQGMIVADGSVRSLTDGAPIKGPAGTGAYSVTSAAQSLDGSRLAVVSRAGGRMRLRVGELEQELSEVDLVATTLSRPTWQLSSGPKEPGTEVWTAVDGTSVTRVTRSDNGSWTAKGVNITDILPFGSISELRLSRDGTRAALVIAGKLYIASVVRDNQDVALRSPRQLQPSILGSAVQSIDWLSQDVLVVSSSLPSWPVTKVYTDGYKMDRYSQSNLNVPVGSVAAAPARQVQVVDPSGLWSASDITDVWRSSGIRVPAGALVFYPG